ncbi:MAG: PDDEXK nuclease domain-containing protein [Bacteroidota bacterium]
MNENLQNREPLFAENQLYAQVKLLIEESKTKVYQLVNTEITMLYWSIGKHISQNIKISKKADYGKNILQTLSAKLVEEYGKGFGVRNLANMVKLFNLFPDSEILQTVSAKLSWSHFVELLSVPDALQREFYNTLCINERWSVRQLNERINSMLYERTALSKKPELTIKNDLETLRNQGEMSSAIVFKDPYILDFLELRYTFSERDLEQAIVYHLQQFILEMGNDFAFLARQKRITVDTTDYYLDLLFFHRKLNRLVAIELKLGKFEHSHKSQMELYLRWLDKYEKQAHENPPLGLILCATKSNELVELLELDANGIHVAEYLTGLPDKALLQSKLQKAIELSKLQLKKGEDNECAY